MRVYFDICEVGGTHGEGAGEILMGVRYTPERKLVDMFWGALACFAPSFYITKRLLKD